LIDSDNEIDVLFTNIGLMDDPQRVSNWPSRRWSGDPSLRCSTRQARR
jgi:hypothetical protein